ncbi:hypothetical protein HK098_007392 [Nowakowskiella sp. JEL0407]|nr:hypothetical protein HK098_007392 [Nowakowskiella sp. JEL0407]
MLLSHELWICKILNVLKLHNSSSLNASLVLQMLFENGKEFPEYESLLEQVCINDDLIGVLIKSGMMLNGNADDDCASFLENCMEVVARCTKLSITKPSGQQLLVTFLDGLSSPCVSQILKNYQDGRLHREIVCVGTYFVRKQEYNFGNVQQILRMLWEIIGGTKLHKDNGFLIDEMIELGTALKENNSLSQFKIGFNHYIPRFEAAVNGGLSDSEKRQYMGKLQVVKNIIR